MNKHVTKKKGQKSADNKGMHGKSEGIAYRLKCAKTANGLSHFVMYGDVPKDKALV